MRNLITLPFDRNFSPNDHDFIWMDLFHVSECNSFILHQFSSSVFCKQVVIEIKTMEILGLFGLVFPKTLWGLQPPPHDVTGDCRCIAAGITRPGTPVTPPPRFPLSEGVPPHSPLIKGMPRGGPGRGTPVGPPERRPAAYYSNISGAPAPTVSYHRSPSPRRRSPGLCSPPGHPLIPQAVVPVPAPGRALSLPHTTTS